MQSSGLFTVLKRVCSCIMLTLFLSVTMSKGSKVDGDRCILIVASADAY